MDNTQEQKKITGDITPLPYGVDKEDNKYYHIVNAIDPNVVASVYADPLDELAEANVMYLIKAANNYPTLFLENEKLKSLNSELVEALETILGIVTDPLNGDIWLNQLDWDKIQKAKELINKAK